MSKQETLEEAFTVLKKEFPILNKYEIHHLLQVARFGAKWQQERMYSEEDLIDAFNEGQALSIRGKLIQGKDWFEQFKN